MPDTLDELMSKAAKASAPVDSLDALMAKAGGAPTDPLSLSTEEFDRYTQTHAPSSPEEAQAWTARNAKDHPDLAGMTATGLPEPGWREKGQAVLGKIARSFTTAPSFGMDVPPQGPAGYIPQSASEASGEKALSKSALGSAALVGADVLGKLPQFIAIGGPGSLIAKTGVAAAPLTMAAQAGVETGSPKEMGKAAAFGALGTVFSKVFGSALSKLNPDVAKSIIGKASEGSASFLAAGQAMSLIEQGKVDPARAVSDLLLGGAFSVQHGETGKAREARKADTAQAVESLRQQDVAAREGGFRNQEAEAMKSSVARGAVGRPVEASPGAAETMAYGDEPRMDPLAWEAGFQSRVQAKRNAYIESGMEQFKAGFPRTPVAEKPPTSAKGWSDAIGDMGQGQNSKPGEIKQLLMDRYGMDRAKAEQTLEALHSRGLIDTDVFVREYGYDERMFQPGGRQNRGNKGRGENLPPERPVAGERPDTRAKQAERDRLAQEFDQKVAPTMIPPPPTIAEVGNLKAKAFAEGKGTTPELVSPERVAPVLRGENPPPSVRPDGSVAGGYDPNARENGGVEDAAKPAYDQAVKMGLRPFNSGVTGGVGFVHAVDASGEVHRVDAPPGGGPPGGEPPATTAPELPAPRGKFKGAVAATGEFLNAQGLNNVMRLSPETGRIASQLTTLRTRAKATAASIERQSMGPVPKALRPKYEIAYSAAQVEGHGGDKENVVGYREAFPTDADYTKLHDSPGYKAFVQRRAPLHASLVQPWNVAGGGLSPEQQAAASQRGTGGEFSNMIALSAGEKTAKGQVVRPKSISGPSVRISPVSEAFTGHAEAYDPSLRAQDERAINLSGGSALGSKVIDSAVRRGILVPVEEGKRGPKGWGTLTIPIATGLDVSKPARSRDFYVHPDAHEEIRTLFGMDASGRLRGVGGVISRGGTQGVIMGTAEALGHGTRTLLPQAVLADRYYGGTVAKDTVKFLFNQEAADQERIRQTEAGVSRPTYEYGKASGLLKPLSEPLVAFDLATRKTLMDKANRDFDSAVKAGKAQESGRYDYVRKEGLRAGQYNALAMDQATKFLRGSVGQFAVAGKLNYANPYKTLAQLMTGSRSGLDASTGTRVANIAKVASLFSAAFMYVGAKNKSKTGSFFPPGVPFGAEADDYDTERKMWTYHWPLLGRAAGLEGVMKKTPVGPVATGINRGEGAGRIALDTGIGQAANIVRPMLSSPLIRLEEALNSGNVSGEKAYDTVKRSVPLLAFLDAMFRGKFREAGEALSGEGRPGKVLSPKQVDALGR